VTTTSLPPGPPFPAFVQMALFLARPGFFPGWCRRRYGDVFTVKLPLSGKAVAIADPALVKQIFAGDAEVLHAGESNGMVLTPILGRNSVLTLDEAPHMRERKLMLPPFHGERMRVWGEAIEDLTADAVVSWPVGRPFPLLPETRRLTLEIILRVVFGIDEVERLSEFRSLLQAMLDFSDNLLALLPWFRKELGGRSPWGRFVRLRREADQAIFAEIQERRRTGVEGRTDVFSMLLEARREDGSPMTDRELRDELMTLLVAGHETTATSLAWAFDLLLHNPETLDKLQTELAEGRMDYLEADIKETMRIRPVIAIIGRLLKRDWDLGGYHLPAGTSVEPHIWLIHHREDIYPEPEKFKPERFLEGPQPDASSYLPFGGGVRRCLGASFATFEMKTVIPQVLALTQMRPADSRPARVKREAVTMVPEGGARVIVEQRKPLQAAVSGDRAPAA
jgi:cytochrome P450